jgi:hypothetical protein
MTDKTLAQRLFPNMASVAAAAQPATTSSIAHRMYPNMARIAAPARPASRIIADNAPPRPGFKKVLNAAYQSGRLVFVEVTE